MKSLLILVTSITTALFSVVVSSEGFVVVDPTTSVAVGWRAVRHNNEHHPIKGRGIIGHSGSSLSMGNYAEVEGGEAFGYEAWTLKASSWNPHSDSRLQRALRMLGGEERFPCLINKIRGDWLGYSIPSDVCAMALEEIEDFKSVGTIGRIPQLLKLNDDGSVQVRISEDMISSEEQGIRFGIELGEDKELYDFVIRNVASRKILFRSKKFQQEDVSLYNKQVESNFGMMLRESKPKVGAVARFQNLENNDGMSLDLSGRAFMLGPFIYTGVFEVDSSIVTASDFDDLLDKWVPPLKASVATGNPIEIW